MKQPVPDYLHQKVNQKLIKNRPASASLRQSEFGFSVRHLALIIRSARQTHNSG